MHLKLLRRRSLQERSHGRNDPHCHAQGSAVGHHLLQGFRLFTLYTYTMGQSAFSMWEDTASAWEHEVQSSSVHPLELALQMFSLHHSYCCALLCLPFILGVPDLLDCLRHRCWLQPMPCTSCRTPLPQTASLDMKHASVACCTAIWSERLLPALSFLPSAMPEFMTCPFRHLIVPISCITARCQVWCNTK